MPVPGRKLVEKIRLEQAVAPAAVKFLRSHQQGTAGVGTINLVYLFP